VDDAAYGASCGVMRAACCDSWGDYGTARARLPRPQPYARRRWFVQECSGTQYPRTRVQRTI